MGRVVDPMNEVGRWGEGLAITFDEVRQYRLSNLVVACGQWPTRWPGVSLDTNAPRILLIEDDPRFAATVRRLLEAAPVCGEVICARSAAEGREHWERGDLDLLILDLGLPDEDGITLVRPCTRRNPPIPVLILTITEACDRIRRALEQGAQGYLLKDDPALDLVAAVQSCLSGASPLSPRVGRHLVGLVREKTPPVEFETLTAREQQVMALLGRGLQYDEIARSLGIAFGTVQTHVKNLYAKLGVGSKAEVARLAARWGVDAVVEL